MKLLNGFFFGLIALIPTVVVQLRSVNWKKRRNVWASDVAKVVMVKEVQARGKRRVRDLLWMTQRCSEKIKQL